MQTLFFLSALVATNLAVGWTWFCLRADRQRSLRNSYPDLLLLGVGVFLCWEPLLFARGLYFGLFYPEWGFIPAWICGYIAVALIFRVYKLRYWTRQAAKFFASKDLREKIFSCRRQLFVFFIGNLVFLSLCSFFFHDYARLAEVAVVAGQSVGESTDMLSPRGRTLNPVGEFTTRVTFPIAGGIIAIIALVFTWKRTSAMMRQTDNSYRQIHAEQFKNAVEHLGNEKQAIVLGGVHALHDLARNNKEYHQQVFEILCSFIREETRKQAHRQQRNNEEQQEDVSDEQYKSATACTSFIVIQTIVDKLFRGEGQEIYFGLRANLHGAHLRKIDLRNANLYRIDLQKADLQQAHLELANLQGAQMGGIKLQGAFLLWANLRKAGLVRANLQGTNLLCADLRGANLAKANLFEALLCVTDTYISQTSFKGVQSSDASMEIIQTAIQNDTELKTDLSGVRIFDGQGNDLQTDADKRKGFTDHGADISDLSAEEVQVLFKYDEE